MCIRNRVLSLIYKLVIVAGSVAAIILNIGLLSGTIDFSPFNYYAMLSGALSLLFFLIACITLCIDIRKKGSHGSSTLMPHFKGAVTIASLVSALVYYFLLLPSGFTPVGPGESVMPLIADLLLHLIIPALVMFDWILFDQKGRYFITDPIAWLLLPIFYYIITIIRVQVFGWEASLRSTYPYFFFDANALSWQDVFYYMAILCLLFLAIGYVIYLLDYLAGRYSKSAAISNTNANDKNKPLPPPAQNNNVEEPASKQNIMDIPAIDNADTPTPKKIKAEHISAVLQSSKTSAPAENVPGSTSFVHTIPTADDPEGTVLLAPAQADHEDISTAKQQVPPQNNDDYSSLLHSLHETLSDDDK